MAPVEARVTAADWEKESIEPPLGPKTPPENFPPCFGQATRTPATFSSRTFHLLPSWPVPAPSTYPGWPAACIGHLDPCTSTWPHLLAKACTKFPSHGRTEEAEAQSTSLGTKAEGWSTERLGPCQVSWDPGTPPPALPSKPQHLLTSLAVIPSEVFWTDAVWASWHIHTGPPLLAGVVFAAVV